MIVRPNQIDNLPPWILIDPLLQNWLLEDIGRGDRSTQSLLVGQVELGKAEWRVKEEGKIAGLPIAARIFQILSKNTSFITIAAEGQKCSKGETIARLHGELDALLMGERVALNLVMRLSGIASLTSKYKEKIADLPTQLVDTRKTTPGLRIMEKYASFVGGAINHRMGLDDAVMIKDNHISAAGSIEKAIATIRQRIPYPLTIEVETNTIEEVRAALDNGADIIMLDNMPIERMSEAVKLIRQSKNNDRVKIEASGNITLETIRSVAETGVDYISTSAPITRSSWLDLSMTLNNKI
ncbi:MAG: carboxylating nicotinate-nucleotide diphosphorylase [Prochloraceae cyanobacterium]